MAKFLLLLIFLFFTVSNVLATEVPVLTSPFSGTTTDDTRPKLEWSWSGPCPSGDCFRVQVDNQTDFQHPEKNYYTPNTYYSPQLSTGTWFWRVQVKGSGVWSEIWNFAIGQSSSQPPTSTSQPTSTPVTTSTGQITLSEFMPNPAEGNEWVEIRNNGNQAVGIGGYRIDDIEAGSSPFTIPQDTIINYGNFAVFYFSPKLNNEGDTVRLLDSSSNVLETYSYSASTKGISFAKDNNNVWQQTSTPTKGWGNIITTPAVEEKSSGVSSKSKTTTKTESPKPTPVGGTTPQTLGKKVTTSKNVSGVSSEQDFATPSFNLATISAEESSPEATVAGSKTSKLGAILAILGGLVILGVAAFTLAKKLEWKF